MSEHTPQMTAALAAKEFARAVESFIDDQLHWDGNTVRKSPGLYGRMRGALTQRGYRLSAATNKSRPPLAIGILDWLTDVDTTIAAEWRAGGGTIFALKALTTVVATPDSIETLQARTGQLTAWARAAVDLLDEAPPRIPVRRPCPVCNSLWTYNREQIRTYALIVSEAGAECHSCRATWDHQNGGLAMLARMLTS